MLVTEKKMILRNSEVKNCMYNYISCLGLLIVFLVVSGCATTPRWDVEPFPTTQKEVAEDTQMPTTEATDVVSVDAQTVDNAVEPAPPESSPEADATTAAQESGAPQDMKVVLQPYDTVRFRFLYWPELDDEQVIRPDGKISLLMVGDVEAQGKTPAELQQELLRLYEPLLKDPEINVVASALASNRAYVFGSVITPGMILLEGKLTLLAAIAQAGGFIENNANKSSVVVVRDINGEQYARKVDIKDAIKNPNSTTFYIEPYDIVYVPETPIVKMNQFVAQYIDGLIPDHIRFGASYSLGGRATNVNTSGTSSSAWQKLPALNFYSGSESK